MKYISILMQANNKWLPLIRLVARLFGARVYVHPQPNYVIPTPEDAEKKFAELIKMGEEDFKAGRGKTFTIEELYAKTNEHA